jgi:hypothetical protein
MQCNANPRYLKHSRASTDSPVRSNNQRTPQCATGAKRVHDAVCHVSHVRHQRLDDTTRLQESSDEGTETDHGASSDLEVGSGASRAGSTSARGSGRGMRARCAAGTRSGHARASGAGAVGGSSASGSSAEDDGGRVVGGDSKSAGGVASAGNGDGVDARGNSGDGGRNANIGVSSRLRGNGSGLSRDDRVSSGLGGDGGGSSGLASDNTQRVGLLEESGLGEGVDRGRLGLGKGRSGESSDSEGGTHFDVVVLLKFRN